MVRANGPRDIVAAVPFQCGFQPTKSVVVISLRGPRHRFGMVSRLDLPPDPQGPAADDESATEGQPWDHEQVADDIAAFVARDGGNGAVVVVYDDAPWGPGRHPHEAFVTALLGRLDRRGLPVLDALYVTAERYWSYTCEGAGCCPADGFPVAEAQSSPVAMAYVMAGLAPLASRDALVERVRPSSPLLVAAVEDSTWGWLAAQAADLDGVLDRFAPATALPGIRQEHLRRWTRETFVLMAALVDTYRDRGGSITVEQAGQLLASLQSRDIRDAVLMGFCRFGMAAPEDITELMAIGFDPDLAVVDNLDRSPAAGLEGSERAAATDEAVERLLVDLCQRVEGPFACAPLTMLAWHSWARGDGATARVTVERALGEDPTYRLAALLLSALDHAVAPEWVRAMRRSDERAG